MGSHRVGHDWSDLAAVAAAVVKNLSEMQETQAMQVWSLGQEDPLEESMATHSVENSMSGKFHRQRSLVGYGPRGLKELDVAEHSIAF